MRIGGKEAQYELALVGREIYDIVPIESEVCLQTLAGAMSSRIRDIEGRVDQYMAWVQELLRERTALQAELNKTLDHRVRRLLRKMKGRK